MVELDGLALLDRQRAEVAVLAVPHGELAALHFLIARDRHAEFRYMRPYGRSEMRLR